MLPLNDIKTLHHTWVENNYRPGALGFALQQYIHSHAISLVDYYHLVEVWPKKVVTTEFDDWFTPSIVESLLDWKYNEDYIYRAIQTCKVPALWERAFPYLFSRLPAFDLEQALRWEPLVKQWTQDNQISFYNHLSRGVAKQFASADLKSKHSLEHINLLRLKTCIQPLPKNVLNTPTSETVQVVWQDVFVFLTQKDWTTFKTEFKEIALLWVKHAPITNTKIYVQHLTELLVKSGIDWAQDVIDQGIPRILNMSFTDNNPYIFELWKPYHNNVPWYYILQKWTNWDKTHLMPLLTSKQSPIPEIQVMLINHKNYELPLKCEVLTIRAELDLISLKDIEQSLTWPKALKEILVFWLLYRNEPIKKEIAVAFNMSYGMNPMFQDEEIADMFLPGFNAISNALKAMNVPWRQALAYTNNATSHALMASRLSNYELPDSI